MLVTLVDHVKSWCAFKDPRTLDTSSFNTLPTIKYSFSLEKDHVSRFAQDHGIGIKKLITLGQFGDGVPNAKNKTVEVLSWSILNFGAQSTRYLFFLVSRKNDVASAAALAGTL